MPKKDYFLIVDTETTNDDRVADFGAIITDRKGKIYTECAVMIHGIFGDVDLFCGGPDETVFSRRTLTARTEKYYEMLKAGSRMYASIHAVNRWLENVKGKYDPYLTAYNLSFDAGKCHNTNIDLAIFDKRFCLWHAAFSKYAKSKAYRKFIIENHFFKPPTRLRNMSYMTNAETMARYVTGNPSMEDEPHTALEDAKLYELPILLDILRKTRKKEWLHPTPFNWRAIQVRDHFQAM